MNETFIEEGCKNLINAIYEQAVRDYIRAVICGNPKNELEDFFNLTGRGQYIKNKCLKEMKICKKLIEKFLESDLEKILIDEKLISIPVLATIIFTRYKSKIKLETKEGKYILRKKKKALAD